MRLTIIAAALAATGASAADMSHEECAGLLQEAKQHREDAKSLEVSALYGLTMAIPSDAPMSREVMQVHENLPHGSSDEWSRYITALAGYCDSLR